MVLCPCGSPTPALRHRSTETFESWDSNLEPWAQESYALTSRPEALGGRRVRSPRLQALACAPVQGLPSKGWVPAHALPTCPRGCVSAVLHLLSRRLCVGFGTHGVSLCWRAHHVRHDEVGECCGVSSPGDQFHGGHVLLGGRRSPPSSSLPSLAFGPLVPRPGWVWPVSYVGVNMRRHGWHFGPRGAFKCASIRPPPPHPCSPPPKVH